MLTNQISLAETSTIEDLADWTERRDALRIRPLLECARLRAAMGITEFPTAAAPAASKPAAARSGAAPTSKARTKGGKRVPKNASAPASNTRTKHTAHTPASSAVR